VRFVYEFRDLGTAAAKPTVRVSTERHPAKVHRQRMVGQQCVGQELANS
jgi:hypothetical protein